MRATTIVLLLVATFGQPTWADDQCPPFAPLENKKAQADVEARAEGLAKYVASGEFSTKLKKEVDAAYAKASKEDFDAIRYTMIATICRQIANDPKLSGAERAALTVKLLKEYDAPSPPSAPATPTATDISGHWGIHEAAASGNRCIILGFRIVPPRELHPDAPVEEVAPPIVEFDFKQVGNQLTGTVSFAGYPLQGGAVKKLRLPIWGGQVEEKSISFLVRGASGDETGFKGVLKPEESNGELVDVIDLVLTPSSYAPWPTRAWPLRNDSVVF